MHLVAMHLVGAARSVFLGVINPTVRGQAYVEHGYVGCSLRLSKGS